MFNLKSYSSFKPLAYINEVCGILVLVLDGLIKFPVFSQGPFNEFLTCFVNTVEPRFNEVVGDRPTLFVKWRVRYIENLDTTSLRGRTETFVISRS